MLALIFWYILITLLGLLAFPLAFKLLPGLADRGYTLARILGLLVWSYIFWLFGSFNLLKNEIGGALVALILLAVLGIWSLRSLDWESFRVWLDERRGLLLTVEVLFLAAFVGWAVVRSANPEITGTEKPMELAFINAIMRSPALPPNDPWLSGYSISYYHFGYVMVAMLARLTSTSGGTAFNLGLSLVFALSAIGAYGLLYNLLAALRAASSPSAKNRPSPFPPLLAPFFVLIVSNLSGLLHLLRVNGIFWRRTESGEWVSPFWAWLDIGSISEPPPENPFYHWWWWQGSRIVQDYDFLGNNKGDVIDEFPFFSYLLGDLHPHVLAMPFAFLGIGLALNLLLGGGGGKIRWLGVIRLNLNWYAFGLAAFALGAMGFLNTWDFPFYVALFAAAYMFERWRSTAQDEVPENAARSQPGFWDSLKDFLSMGFSLGVTGALLFLPFYLTFSSQAGGFIPNLIYITKGVYIWIQFAPLLIPLFGLLFYLWKQYGDRRRLSTGVKVTLVIIALLLAVTLFLTGMIPLLHLFSGINSEASVAQSAFLDSLKAPGLREAVVEGFYRRLAQPGALLTLGVILAFVIALLWPARADAVERPSPARLPDSHIFALLLVFIASMLVLVPEFFFLRDFFGYRINTIFKFYFLAWLMWAVAAAYAVVVLWKNLAGAWSLVFKVVTVLVIAASMLYPVMGVWSKTNGFDPPQWELDGTGYLNRLNPDEAAAMHWLASAPLGVVAEAAHPASSYTNYARMATHSGQPAVLGWIGHEHQWRGGYEEVGSRDSDLQRLYCGINWPEARPIIEQYRIRYIVVGNLERTTYAAGTTNCPTGLSEGKFARDLEPVFQQGSVTIYEVP